MSDILFINGPIKKYVRQICKCKNSYCRNITEYGEATIKDDRVYTTVDVKLDVCDRCKTPYEVWYDTSNCLLVKNIGDDK